MLKKLSEKHNYEIITIRLIADFETLWSRRRARDSEESRHLCHNMTHYHYGDQLKDRIMLMFYQQKKNLERILI